MRKYFPQLLILSILITAGSYFIKITPPGQLDASVSYRGLIIPYWSQTHATYDFGTGEFPTFPPRWNFLVFIIDILIWTLILKAGWFIFERIKKRGKT